MKASNRSDELSRLSAADLAAEISRLETLMGTSTGSERYQLGSGKESSLLREEMRRGPLADHLKNSDENPQLALLKARAQLAAYNARVGVETAAGSPPWLKTLVTALVVPLILGLLLNFFTTQQQLKLFREQKAVEAMRAQADILLGKLSSLVVSARELKNSVENAEIENLSQSQADLLSGKAIEFEQEFRQAVQLHDFDAYPDLRNAELMAFSELRALEDCLDQAAGREPTGAWRKDISKEDGEKLLRAATSEAPCGKNFDSVSFESLTSAINRDISKRIGGSLFPGSSSTN